MPIERHHTLVTVDLISRLRSDGVTFAVRYQVVERTGDDPWYECVYSIPKTDFFPGTDSGLLIRTNLGFRGISPRRFKLFPGLVHHHKKFGDGTALLLDPETYEITCVDAEAAKALASEQ